VQVHALHVHHGLHADADAWMAQVAAQCRRWRRAGSRMPFHGHRVHRAAAARRQRRGLGAPRALRGTGRHGACGRLRLVLLAHHRRDQAETVLLQALRGAGPAGLAAMPREAERGRPDLGAALAAPAAQRHRGLCRRWRLSFVADPANADDRHARSRLRQQLWPALTGAFADAETTLLAVARRAQEARAILAQVAQQDLQGVADGQGLRLAAWLALPAPRQANVLRHWLHLLEPVPETLVLRLQAELPVARSGAAWPLGARQLRLHKGRLAVVAAAASVDATQRAIDLGRPGRFELSPWAGALCVEPVRAGGVPADALRHAELRARHGGEQFQARAGGMARSLKKQFQAHDVPAWQREVPLVYAQGQLVFVPGLGTDARALAWPGSPRVQLRWLP
jgi:tRNA(Ile)-lysidine synthase